jgi:hypothetical protein
VKRIGLLVILALAGCSPKDDPLLPELKGRWAAEAAVKLRSGLRPADKTPASTQELCRTDYVTFGKRAVTLHSGGQAKPFFVVREVRRDRSRIILVGAAPVFGADSSSVELVLRNGEIRLDDVIDERGRSVRYQRFENAEAQQTGVRTIGDLFGLVFDLKACSV